MTSLAHPEIPARVIEAMIEWEQPTPAQYERVAPTPVVEILSDSDEHDPEAEEDLDEDPKEEDPEEETAEEPTLVHSSEASGSDGPGEGGQQDWLLESSSKSSHQFQLERMADHHRQLRADRTDPPPPVGDHHSDSVSVPSKRVVASESSGSGSYTVLVEVHTDSSSEEDLDSSSSEEDQ